MSWVWKSKRDRKAKTVTITHRQMIRELLEQHAMLECRKATTPLVPREKLSNLKEDPSQEIATRKEHERYMKVVGSIQYIASVTRPDLAFAAHALARHMAESTKAHWRAAQHVLRYLRTTVDLGLTFHGSGYDSILDAYTDADFANCLSMKSVSGLVLRMYGNTVLWRSKRQEVIAGDTTEAELVAMSSAANELIWAKQLCTDLRIHAPRPVLWGDNKSANLLAVNPVSSDRSKTH